MKKINILLLIISAFLINIFNQIFFCIPDLTCINPFYDIRSFSAFLASVLGISIGSLGISLIVSFVIILITKNKQNFLSYFSFLFLIFSLIFLYISYSNYIYKISIIE